MAINVELLSKICQTPGAPGFEQKVRELVIDEVKPYVDSIEETTWEMFMLSKRKKR